MKTFALFNILVLVICQTFSFHCIMTSSTSFDGLRLQTVNNEIIIPAPYDYFLFVQTWPGSYNTTSRKLCDPSYGKLKPQFVIHGLWPTFVNESSNTDCDPQNPLNPSKIASLISNLEQEWPDLSCPSKDGKSFWKHEWDKHGTCSDKVLDQKAYFQANLNLKKKANLTDILKKAGIIPKPKDGSVCQVSSIRSAIAKALKCDPAEIICNFDDGKKYNRLFEVRMCVDPFGADLIRYPNRRFRTTCTNSVKFPTF